MMLLNECRRLGGEDSPDLHGRWPTWTWLGTCTYRRISHDSCGQRSSRSAIDVPERERTERRLFAGIA